MMPHTIQPDTIQPDTIPRGTYILIRGDMLGMPMVRYACPYGEDCTMTWLYPLMNLHGLDYAAMMHRREQHPETYTWLGKELENAT